jgi:hypothetical protein
MLSKGASQTLDDLPARPKLYRRRPLRARGDHLPEINILEEAA